MSACSLSLVAILIAGLRQLDEVADDPVRAGVVAIDALGQVGAHQGVVFRVAERGDHGGLHCERRVEVWMRL
jgi:hypothetical protein